MIYMTLFNPSPKFLSASGAELKHFGISCQENGWKSTLINMHAVRSESGGIFLYIHLK
jgi:hypothetical protein